MQSLRNAFAQEINICYNGQSIQLDTGRYKIDLLGGWGVKLGEFSISLTHDTSGRVVDCTRSFWPIQTFALNKRAKRIFSFEITEPGTYRLEFTRTETLTVKHSSLFIAGFFEEAVPPEKISIYIHN